MKRIKKCFFFSGAAGAATLGTLLAAELTLRAVGFSFHLYPERIEFGMPDPVVLAKQFRPDPDLLWVGTNYVESLKALQAQPPDLVFMGCSCTALGRYDQYLADRLQGALDHPVRYFNAAAVGWSSYQGLQQMRRDLVALRPKIITLYFGWNDHWIGFGIEDKDVARVASGTALRRHSRVIQLVDRARVALLHKDTRHPLRVAPEDFRRNLEEMVRVARAHRIVPVLVTAASGHERGREPAYLRERWIRNLDELIPLHQQYVDIVREVARDQGAPLVDLAALPEFKGRTPLLMPDGIHLTEAGSRRAAQAIFDTLQQDGLLARLAPSSSPSLLMAQGGAPQENRP